MMLPSDSEFSKLQKKWEDDQEKEYQAMIDDYEAPEQEEEQ